MPFSMMAYDRLQGIDFPRMRAYRLERAKKMMEEDGVDLLVTWEPWNVRYLTGGYLNMQSRWACEQFAILPRNGEPHLYAYTCYDPDKAEEEMPWMEGRIHPVPFGGKLAMTPEQIEGTLREIGRIMAEYGITSGTVGLDNCPNYYMYEARMKTLGFRVVDPVFTLFKARAVKNVDEVACVRMACHTADAAFSAIRRAIRPGIRESELQGIGQEALFANGTDESMDFVVASGPRTFPLHIDYTDRIIRPGDYIDIDINGNSYMGYKSCYYRTFICGEANEEQKEGFEVARKMMYDGMAQIKPGNTTADCLAVWPKGPEFWGYEPDYRRFLGGLCLAHGIGLSLHEYPMFGVGGPSEAARAVEFEEGMCIAVETYFGDRNHERHAYGTRVEECVAVTKDGYELLTRFPIDSIIECPY